MAQMFSTITVHVHVRLSFWQALKLRLAGPQHVEVFAAMEQITEVEAPVPYVPPYNTDIFYVVGEDGA